MNNNEIESLLMQRAEINRKITAAKRVRREKERFEVRKFPTGKISVYGRDTGDEYLRSRFHIVSSGWSVAEALAEAERYANDLMAFCKEYRDKLGEENDPSTSE